MKNQGVTVSQAPCAGGADHGHWMAVSPTGRNLAARVDKADALRVGAEIWRRWCDANPTELASGQVAGTQRPLRTTLRVTGWTILRNPADYPDCREDGKVNATALAEAIAQELDNDAWLDDETHLVWEVALKLSQVPV